MTDQAMRVVNELFDEKYGCSIYLLAWKLDIPQASIRRSIQELRREGYPVTNKGLVVSLYPRA